MARRRWRDLLGVPVALVGLGVGSGCSDSDGDVVVVEDGDYRIFVNQGEQLGGPDMAVGGELVYSSERHCFHVLMDGVQWAIVWPDGSRSATQSGSRAVEVPGFGVVAEGDTISVRALWADRRDGSDAYAAAVNQLSGLDVVDGCVSTSHVMVVDTVWESG